MIYATPNGIGNGTINNPTSLTGALQSILPDGTIWMYDGVYTGKYTSTANGVHLKPVLGAKPIIDGSLTVNGSGTTIEGLEIHSTAWLTRQSAFPDDSPPDISVLDGVTIAVANCIVRNCYIHDCRQGIYAGSNAPNLVVAGCLLLNNGWYSTIRGSGHGVYFQNADLLNPKIMRGCVIGPQYGYGLHCYGSDGSHLNGFTLHDNVHLWHGLIGGNSTVTGVSITKDRYFDGLQLGYNVIPNADVVLTDCLIAAFDTYALNIYHWSNAQIANNRIATNANFIIDQIDVDASAWQNNDYFHDSSYTQPFGMTFATWQQSGRDVLGSFATGVSADVVTVSEWFGNRAIITIENWSNQPSVLIDLSTLGIGPFLLKNVLNPNETLVIPNTVANVPMMGWSVAIPYADSVPLTTWNAQYAVFIVETI